MREHWLEHAHGRIVAGDDELDVLADYGWVQITDKERKAIATAVVYLKEDDDFPGIAEDRATLRKLLERLAVE
jgi:hypothetical protein